MKPLMIVCGLLLSVTVYAAEDKPKGSTAEQYAGALRHDQQNPLFNPHVRQLLHVGYKIAANLGDRYTALLESCEESISRNVTQNLYDRHIEPLFVRS